MAIMDYDSEESANHREVIEIANLRARDIETLITDFVSHVGNTWKERIKIFDILLLFSSFNFY